MAFARTVVLEHRAARVIDAGADEHPRLREIYDGLEWRIARKPEGGEPVAGFPNRFVVHSLDWPKFPGTLVLAYEYTDNEVNIIGARIVPRETDEAEKPQLKSA